MDEKKGRSEGRPPKEKGPKSYVMKVPPWAVLYADPLIGVTSKVGLVRDFFSLEEVEPPEGKAERPVEEFAMIRCLQRERRTIGEENGRKIRWDRVEFQVMERNNGDEFPVTKWGYFATLERTEEEKEAREPFQYLGEDGFRSGPRLKEKPAPGLQHQFVISKKLAPVGQRGRPLKR